MTSLPKVSGRDVVAALRRAGFELKRQSGSHIILVKPGHPLTLSVPDHRELKPGTLRTLIRNAGLTVNGVAHLIADSLEASGRARARRQ